MGPSAHSRFFLLVICIYFLSGFSAPQEGCNTQANPYCAGDPRFANICCPSPSVCYFQDRLGTPGCCAAGTFCSTAGNNPSPPIATVAPSSAISLASGLGQITASMTILSANSVVLATPAAAFSTVGGLLVGAARPIAQAKEACLILVPVCLIAWHIV